MKNALNNCNDDTYVLSRTNRLWLVLVLGALSAFGPLSIDMYLPSLPKLTMDMQTSPSLAQLSLTFCLLGISLGQLAAGPLSDVYGRRRPLIGGLVLYAVSSLLCAFSTSIWSLIVLRFIQGVAGSAGIVISRAIVRDLYAGTELTKFYSMLMVVNGIAPILAPIFGGQLLKVTTWHGVFVVLSVIGVGMLLAVVFGLPETLRIQQRSSGGIHSTLLTFRSLLTDRVFMGYAISQGLILTAMFAYISGSPFVLQNIFGVTPQLFSLFFAINGLGIIIASQVAGKLAGRMKETRLFVGGLVYAMVGGILLLIMILIGAGLYAILLPLFIIVSSVGIVTTTGFSLAMQKYGKAAGSASSLLGLVSYISGGVVAPLVGLGGSYDALPMGIIITTAEIGAFLCYPFILRPRLKHD